MSPVRNRTEVVVVDARDGLCTDGTCEADVHSVVGRVSAHYLVRAVVQPDGTALVQLWRDGAVVAEVVGLQVKP